MKQPGASLLVLLLVLMSCSRLTPLEATVQTAIAEMPAFPLAAATAQMAKPIGYYYFVESPAADLPPGSVVILADTLVLAPTVTDLAPAADTAANIRSALEAALSDPRNVWINKSLKIDSVSFGQGRADVVLGGEMFGAGDVVMIAARMQILMTVFANAAVQRAAITLNGECIGNLGVSHVRDYKPVDYVYTRAVIEDFMAANAPVTP